MTCFRTDDDYMPEEGGYYSNYNEAVWQTFVAVTSSSFPNQIVPEVAAYRYFALFTMFFIGIASFVMLDICLATVNAEFQRGVATKKRHEDKAQSELLLSAFHILLEASTGEEEREEREDAATGIQNVRYTAYNEGSSARASNTNKASTVSKHGAPSSPLGAPLLPDSSTDSSATGNPLHGSDPHSPHAQYTITSPGSEITSPELLHALNDGAHGEHGQHGKSRRTRHLQTGMLEELWDEVYENYNDFRKGGIPDEPRRAIIANIMDMDGDGRIGVEDFNYFLDVSRVHLTRLREDWISLDQRKAHRERMLELYYQGIAPDGKTPISDLPWGKRLYRWAKTTRLAISRDVLNSWVGKYV